MKALKTIGALVLVTTMLTTPIAWGCVSAARTDCALSDCPLGAAMTSADCHPATSSPEPELAEDRFGECCTLAPQVPHAISFDSLASAGRFEVAVSLVGSRTLDREFSGDPPEPATAVIATQQHELGRFTLNSSFLL